MKFARHRRLLGVISPMIAWAVYFVAVYGLQGLGCTEGWHRVTVAGTDVLTGGMALLSLATLVTIAWLGHRGWIGWRRGRADLARGRDAAQRDRTFGLVMLVLAVLAFIATVLTALPIAMVPPCL